MAFFTRITAVSVLLCSTVSGLAQLQVIPQTNAQALAQKIVGNGVTISNVVLSASPLSTGFFYNRGGTQLGIDSGIVLSTGRVLSTGSFRGIDGPATGTNASNQVNTPGDPSLDNLVSPRKTNDAVVLEFDFVPLGDSVKFKYVFSSEEYPQFTCTNYNDVFAFFITGPGITGIQNMALVPGTNIPVAINSINSGIPGSAGGNISNCQAMGAGSPFIQYYINNAGNGFFTHNGHTVVLTAQAGVQPCQTYHLKIAIADVQDLSFDSGVFLEAESLRSDPIRIISSLPQINGQPYIVEGCQSSGIKIARSRKSPNAQPVNIAFGGTGINGIDYGLVPATATIPANDSVVFIPLVPLVDQLEENIENIRIYVSNGCILSNLYIDSIQIQIRDYDTLDISPSKNIQLCQKQPVQLNVQGNYNQFSWTPVEGLSNPGSGQTFAGPSLNTIYYCTATLGDCRARDSVRVVLKTLDLVSKKDVNCINGSSGEIRISGGAEWPQPVQYSLNQGNFSSDSVFTGLGVGNYTLRIRDAGGCIDSLNTSLVLAHPELRLFDSVVSASCNGTNGKLELTATGGQQPYTFLVDGQSFSHGSHELNSGQHLIGVRDNNGCESFRSLEIAADPLLNFTTRPSASLCQGSASGYLYVQATGGSGQYLYSMDAVNFGSADSFFVSQSQLTVSVKDNKGCFSSKAVNIPVNQAVFINAGPDTAICEGSSYQFPTLHNALSLSWIPVPGLSGYTVADPVARPVNTSTYYVTASKYGCVVSDTVTLLVRPAPVASAGIDTSICFGRSIALNGAGGIRYSWLPQEQVSDPSIASPLVHPAVTTNFYLRVYDVHDCSSLRYDTVQVQVVPGVLAFAGKDTVAAMGQPIQLLGKELGNSGVTKFHWSPDRGLSNPDIPNPIAVLEKDVTFTLTLTTPEGCLGTDQVEVRVFASPEIFVPSGFTPNGDGLNDILRPIPVGMKEFRFFKVFNRWGQEIFTTRDERKGWDGKWQGKMQSTGTFVWMAEAVDYSGRVVRSKGMTTVIR
jgi:gliding motility-associated-like protein